MLKLYHAQISPNSRRVWIALLEKGLDFDLIQVNLNGEQYNQEFLLKNPFHHVPILVDDGFKIIESLAILDYLEAKYPEPVMLPKNARDLALVRMIQLVSANELLPATIALSGQILGLPGGDAEKIQQAQQKAETVLKYFESLLDDRPYFGSEYLTLADIAAGTIVPWLLKSSLPFYDYPKLDAWCNRLLARPSWQATEPSIEAIKSRMS
ncbi:glutathione S-transferase family protein [Nostoc sp. MS1]|uniref:glutathione S-transferase family protein n=1 Tax=Nostoc sp. MS1 TaxID=2764711 RepID=UPI001CC68D49|nr:glutathione S-transferase family protein [Nostoc sp. MS1]BCL36063.1 glutathione S-transferase [Nostoc sp. MS1]